MEVANLLLVSILLLQLQPWVIQAKGKCIKTMKANNRCPPPWLAWGNHCYLSVAATRYYNFHDGMQYCLQFTNPDGKAAHLASVTSEEENQFLLSYATAAGNQGFWIGYQYNNAQGRFIWVDGTSEAGYENWYPGQPTYGGRDCVAVYDAFWRSVWCTNSNGFVCKMAI